MTAHTTRPSTTIDEVAFYRNRLDIRSALDASIHLVDRPNQKTPAILRRLPAGGRGRLIVGYAAGSPVLVVPVEAADIGGLHYWRTLGHSGHVGSAIRADGRLVELLTLATVDLIRKTLVGPPGSFRQWSRPAGLLLADVPDTQWGAGSGGSSGMAVAATPGSALGLVNLTITLMGCTSIVARALAPGDPHSEGSVDGRALPHQPPVRKIA